MSIKVIFFIHTSVGYGANKSLLELLDYLVVRDIECIVIGADELDLASWLCRRGITYININSRLSTYPPVNRTLDIILWLPRLFYHRLRNILAFVVAFNFVKRENPDIIHTNIGPYSIGFLIAKLLRRPHIWHIREYQKEDFGLTFLPFKNFFKLLLNNNTKNIFITNDLKANFGHPRNSSVVYDGVSIPTIEPHPLRVIEDKYFLYCGRIEPAKGVLLIVEAFSRFLKMSGSTVKLVFLGDGDAIFLAELKKTNN